MFSLEQILEWSGGWLANPGLQGSAAGGVSRMAPLRASGAGDLCFFFSKEYQQELPAAQPSVLITGEAFVQPLQASGLPLWTRSFVVACQDPYLAMAKLSARFAGEVASREYGSFTATGIHPTAVVHPSARIAATASVGPHCVIERDAEVGENTRVMAGGFIGVGSRIGADSLLFPKVTIYHGCRVGDRVRLHSGVVVGSDGFGYAADKSSGRISHHEKIHHLGGVVIGNDVEIGASTAVDRGTIGDTIIEDLVKIDNLVQVGHNSTIRQGAVLCGMSGTAGGSVVGRFAYLGGRAIVINKAEVGDGAMLAADCVVTKDVAPGEQVAGSPHRPVRDHLKIQARLSRMIEATKEQRGEKA
jgi:UDP-3-O-[3-hydroxymyristoyl] glucosamine N-acyltransferase